MRWRRTSRSASFNEAPALRGGKHCAVDAAAREAEASMRPPHYAGENLTGATAAITGLSLQ